ncbi:U11/U12 small nuclear ribonucleoprotein 59 kDa protein-like [Bidens hawaiensis]|uniref:U11/U12 small nuclear ribonucleoprotein 59 kDa protein-like n=1 Tax=Bidens hawaiensis TaxID=980011 RepID=UPI00404B6F32
MPSALPDASFTFDESGDIRNRGGLCYVPEEEDGVGGIDEDHEHDSAYCWERELEMLIAMKGTEQRFEGTDDRANEAAIGRFSKFLENYKTPWEEKSAAVRLSNKIQKHKRNKLWRKRKRQRVGEMLAKERERFDQVDQEADEWRAREIAKETAKRKVEKMKEIAKQKANEERRRLESELELLLIVEKLQELRSIRIQKLTKQGHFLPDEDNKFMERIRAAVEEEERQAMAAADTGAAKDAIVTAEESRNARGANAINPEDQTNMEGGDKINQEKITETEAKGSSTAVIDMESGNQRSNVAGSTRGYDYSASLPLEFYHYYHGSNTDMGTLIEVRRTWDAYIRPGGSRIPGHWVQPPPPADDI